METLLNLQIPLTIVILLFATLSAVLLYVKATKKKDLTILSQAISRTLFVTMFLLHKFYIFRSVFLLDFSLLIVFVADLTAFALYFASNKYIVELQAKRLRKTLSDLMYKYSIIVDSSPLGFYAFNESLLIEYVNDRTCALLGYTHSEMLNTPITNYIYQGELKEIENKVRDRFYGTNLKDTYPLTLKTKAGELLKVIIMSYKTTNGHPTSTGMILTEEQCPKVG